MSLNDILLNSKHADMLDLLHNYMFTLEHSAKLINFGVEEIVCKFVNDQDKSEIILLNNFDEKEVELSFSEWLYYLEEGKKIYLENHPEDEPQINKWLEDYKKITNLD